MFSQLFLDFLYVQGFLTKQQVRDVTERKKAVKVPIGVLIVDAGFMTLKQVETVLRIQATHDLRFGEIAIKNGFITAEQFAEVLKTQPKEHVYLSQVLTEWGIMDFDAVLEQIVAFQTAYALDNDQMARLIDNDVEEFVVSIARVGEENALFKEFAVQFLKVVTRFVDRNVLVRPAYQTREIEYKYLAHQACAGSNALYCCFAPDPGGMLTFARLYSKQPVMDIDELAKDSICEFLNCVDGLFVTHLSDEGITEYDIEPPVFQEDGVVSAEEPFCILPFTLSCGEFAIFAPAQDAIKL